MFIQLSSHSLLFWLTKLGREYGLIVKGVSGMCKTLEASLTAVSDKKKLTTEKKKEVSPSLKSYLQ